MFRLFMYETVIDPSEASAGAEATEPEAGAAAEAPEATAPPEASTWAPSRDEWEQSQHTLQQTTAFLGELRQMLDDAGEGEDADFPEIDPFADDAPQQIVALAERIADQKFEERFGAMQPLLDDVVTEKGDAIRNQILDSVKPQVAADFDEDTETAWREAANHFAGAFFNPADPSSAAVAVQQGAQYAAKLIQSQRMAAVDAYKRQIGEIAEQPAEPGAGGGALPIEPKADSYDEIGQRWAARHRG